MPTDFIIPTYIAVWWITLFFLLPIGIKPQENPDKFSYAAAPANPNLKKKILWNFPLAAVFTAGIHALILALR